jgi:dynein heavy chain
MLSLLVPKGKPVLFTGASGVSKTATMLQYLQSLDRDTYAIKTTPFSFVTTPEIFQRTLESCVEKRQGRTFGPPGGKRCAMFIDDISMPVINNWGDQVMYACALCVCVCERERENACECVYECY